MERILIRHVLLMLIPVAGISFGYLLVLWSNSQNCTSKFKAATATVTTAPITQQQSSLQLQLETWHRYADVQPSTIVLRGDPRRCTANDTNCNNHQKVYDAIELMSLPATAKCAIQRLVGTGDPVGGQGPYKVCLDRPHRPIADQCLVYSFGIADDWSFDDSMAGLVYIPITDTKVTFKEMRNLLRIGCDVVSFDPSIGLKAHNRSATHQFFPFGLASQNGVYTLKKDDLHEVQEQIWQMRTIDTLHNELGHSERIIDILKIDTEGAEVDSLAQLIAADFLTKRVRMLLVEWHLPVAPIEQILASYYQLRYVAGFEAYYVEPRFQSDSFYTVEGMINTKLAST